MGEINPDPDSEASPFGVDPDSLEVRQGSDSPTPEDWERLQRLSRTFDEVREFGRHKQRPYAGAPVRSKPQRTYDPAHPTRDPEGDYVPIYLADMFFRMRENGTILKEHLRSSVKSLGYSMRFRSSPSEGRQANRFKCKSENSAAESRGLIAT